MSMAIPQTAAMLPNTAAPNKLEPVCVIFSETCSTTGTGFLAVTD